MCNKKSNVEQQVQPALQQCDVMRRCDNCGKSADEQATVEHDDVEWCLDCMRRLGYCITCDAYIPSLVDDYYYYEDDQCPKCVANGA